MTLLVSCKTWHWHSPAGSISRKRLVVQLIDSYSSYYQWCCDNLRGLVTHHISHVPITLLYQECFYSGYWSAILPLTLCHRGGGGPGQHLPLNFVILPRQLSLVNSVFFGEIVPPRTNTGEQCPSRTNFTCEWCPLSPEINVSSPWIKFFIEIELNSLFTWLLGNNAINKTGRTRKVLTRVPVLITQLQVSSHWFWLKRGD